MSREEDGNGWILKYFKRYGIPVKENLLEKTCNGN